MPPTFSEFAAQRLSALLRSATALTCDPHLAQDVVQEVLIRTQRDWERIGVMDSPLAYVRKMIFNEYLSWRRRRANRDLAVSHPLLVQLGGAGLDDHAAQFAERDAMRVRIARLSRRQRAVIVLRYYENLSDSEIAGVLGCSAATVRSHVSHALAALRAQDAGEARVVALRPSSDLGVDHAV
jgi:RNA polymerase sigma-70 factor (sigma-E family)